ncbi:MAG: YfhO family protein, partial [Ruminococcus sp.]|nr:YfhO family protein [Ruminococcus sp.]
LCVCTCSEAIIADTAAFPNNIDRNSYVSDYSDFREIKDKLDTIEQDKFYRMELTDLRTRMDPSWFGYNGVSVFSSMAYETVARLEKRFGMMSNNINSYTYNPQTPVYNMMHSLKYIVNNASPNILSEPYYTKITDVDKYTAFANNYYLPIAYCVDRNIENWDYGGSDNDTKSQYFNPFDIQGDFFDKATGAGNPFVYIPISYVSYNNVEPFTEDLNLNSFYYKKNTADTDASAVFTITAQQKGNVYIAFKVDGGSEKNITVTSKLGTISHNAGQYCILDLGRYDADDSISITIPFESDSGNVKLYAYTVDDSILNKGYEKLSDEAMSIEKFEDTVIEGTITAKANRTIYTSIPFDYGWTIYIDDKPVDMKDMIKLGNAFLGVNVAKGNHKIRFEYKAPAIDNGLKISIFFALVLILYIVVTLLRKRSTKPPKRPTFNGIDNSYNEEIFLLLPKKKSVSVVKPLSYPTADDGLPKREVFAPQKKATVVTREVFAPPVINSEAVAQPPENNSNTDNV